MTAPAIKPAVLKVRTVYGHTLLVSREHYESERTQLAMYTSTGRRLSDHYASMGWASKPCTLHRANIEEVLS